MDHPARVEMVPIARILESPEFLGLADECAVEAKSPAAPRLNLDFDRYKDLERIGVLCAFRATYDDRLVGFLFLLMSEIPHYKGVVVATTESLYVSPDYRGYGTGARLVAEAERVAAENGVKTMMVTAPCEGRFIRAIGALGYGKTHEVFMKAIA